MKVESLTAGLAWFFLGRQFCLVGRRRKCSTFISVVQSISEVHHHICTRLLGSVIATSFATLRGGFAINKFLHSLMSSEDVSQGKLTFFGTQFIFIEASVRYDQRTQCRRSGSLHYLDSAAACIRAACSEVGLCSLCTYDTFQTHARVHSVAEGAKA